MQRGLGSFGAELVRDYSDLSMLFQDAAGTFPVTSHGDRIRRVNNKGTAGSYWLAPSDDASPKYQTDGTHHWAESDGANDVLIFQGTIPFSVDVFEAVAFRTISHSHSFAHIINYRGGGSSDPQQRQPLIFTPSGSPNQVTVSFGGPQMGVDTGSSIVGKDVIVTASNDPTGQRANVNGNTVSAAGVTLTSGGTDPYRIFGPNFSNIRDYGGLHMNRVPSAQEEAFIRAVLARKSDGIA